MLDWEARFQLVFASAKIKVDAAHNHKSKSIDNPHHG